MKRLIYYIWNAFKSERGAITPTMIMMSGILTVSGGAFMSLAVHHDLQMTEAVTETQAKTVAEREVRRTLWRIGHTDPRTWAYWASAGDTNTTAVFDSASGLLTVAARVGDRIDTIRVYISYNPIWATKLNNIVSYYDQLVHMGTIGEMSYQPGYAPRKVDARSVLDFNTYWNNANYRYDYNKVFEGKLNDGLHVVNGMAQVMPGTELNGSIVALGSVVIYGNVEITAKAISKSKKKLWKVSETETTYLPAVASRSGSITAYSTIDQDRIWEYYDMLNKGVDLRTIYKTVFNYARIKGMTYSYWGQYYLSTDIDGMIVGGEIQLWDAYTVSYNGQYINPPPATTLWPDRYEPLITQWVEGRQTSAPAPEKNLDQEYLDTDQSILSTEQ